MNVSVQSQPIFSSGLYLPYFLSNVVFAEGSKCLQRDNPIGQTKTQVGKTATKYINNLFLKTKFKKN